MLEEVKLPSKHVMYSLTTAEPDEEFLERRRSELSNYLDKIIRTVGVGDAGFWNHPRVMTFLDIPLAPSSGPLAEIDSVIEWDRELAGVQEAIRKAHETSDTRQAMLNRAIDISGYNKNLRRQINGIQKRLERLSAGVHNLQKNPITGALQLYLIATYLKNININVCREIVRERRALLDISQSECVGLLDTLHGVEAEKEELLSSPGADTATPAQRTPPTPTTPGPRSTIIPDDIADALRYQHRSSQETLESALKLQQDLMSKQDEKLAQITRVAQLNKNTAIAIRDEVDEQNRMLDAIAGQTDEAKSKISVAQRRVKRI